MKEVKETGRNAIITVLNDNVDKVIPNGMRSQKFHMLIPLPPSTQKNMTVNRACSSSTDGYKLHLEQYASNRSSRVSCHNTLVTSEASEVLVDDSNLPILVGMENDNDEKLFMLPLVSNRAGSQGTSPDLRRSSDNKNNGFKVLSNFFTEKQKDRIRQCHHCILQVQKHIFRSTLTVMNVLTRVLFWVSVVAMAVGVVWYSRELYFHGTDPHLIAWFSAGGFVILGFPISIYGILMHLSNYYQPNIQCYVVRILWMIPLYSIESWLCLRFHVYAIYIETLRDCYESFVLYCFLQFLIQVLGGEETLIMILKDKSPTRGVHYIPLNWCLKPWTMGQPVAIGTMSSVICTRAAGCGIGACNGGRIGNGTKWTSPFFVRCKFGVLQYVLLKLVSSIFVMVLEVYGLYKDGDFTPRCGYLYICIVTNLSQCWALYCLVIFYYATKNELSPIRPVGKFLSVKALIFFTWWQSVGISILFQIGLIQQYKDGEEWTAEDVAKGLQDYLICVEMFIGAIVHTIVFPHTDYLKPMATSMNKTKTGTSISRHVRRLGRRARRGRVNEVDEDEQCTCDRVSSNMYIDTDLESENHLNLACESAVKNLDTQKKGIYPLLSHPVWTGEIKQHSKDFDDKNIAIGAKYGREGIKKNNTSEVGILSIVYQQQQHRTGFVHALIDSTVPRDVMNNTVGIARGEFHVEKKSLLSHAAASDEYELFVKRRRGLPTKSCSQNMK